MEREEICLSQSQAKEMIERLFNIQVVSCKAMSGYVDLNFLVRDSSGCFFVFKIMNKNDSENLCYIEQQNEAMLTVTAAGLGSQKPIKSREGRFTEVEVFNGRSHAVRVLTFAMGTTMEDEKVRIDPCLMYSVGVRVAKIDRLLATTFPTEAVSRHHTWSIWSVPQIYRMMEATPHLEDRGLLMEVFRCIEDEVLPKMDKLTTGPIHSDANFANIIVQQGESSNFHLNSIIDFGDLHLSANICGLATLCAYVILGFVAKQWTVEISEYSAPKYCIAGYLSENNLPKTELDLLPKLVAFRYAQSLTIGAYSFHVLNPNNESLLTTQKSGWRQLKHIWSTNHEDLLAEWLSLL